MSRETQTQALTVTGITSFASQVAIEFVNCQSNLSEEGNSTSVEGAEGVPLRKSSSWNTWWKAGRSSHKCFILQCKVSKPPTASQIWWTQFPACAPASLSKMEISPGWKRSGWCQGPIVPLFTVLLHRWVPWSSSTFLDSLSSQYLNDVEKALSVSWKDTGPTNHWSRIWKKSMQWSMLGPPLKETIIHGLSLMFPSSFRRFCVDKLKKPYQ